MVILEEFAYIQVTYQIFFSFFMVVVHDSIRSYKLDFAKNFCEVKKPSI